MIADSNAKIYSSLKKSRGRHGRVIVAVVAVFAVCGGVCAVFGRQMYQNYQHQKLVASVLDTGRFYQGISVQGVGLGGMTMQQAQQTLKNKATGARRNYDITITYGGKSWKLTQADMKFTYDTENTLEKAYDYGRSGDRERRYQQVCALKTQPKDYPVTALPDENDLKAKVQKIAAEVNRKPQNPTVTSFDPGSKSFACKDGVDGLEVNTDALWRDVKAVAYGSRSGTVKMAVNRIPFSQSIADVKNHMQKLGTFSSVSTNNYNGTFNMKRALVSVNGTCVPAGGVFSFLGTVGECDASHGYLPAGAILDGKLIQEDGGGICQASTTVYGAALRSGMTIVERYNHTMPSSYCTIGQDATVSYPGLDFKFKNQTDYPIYILTQSSGRVLTVTFYGYQPPDYDEIRITSRVLATYPAPSQAKYVEDKTMPSGTVKMSAKAHTGYKVAAERTFYKNGAVVRTESLPSSYYKPLPAYYSYGKGANPSSQVSSQASSQPNQASSAPAAKPAPSSSKPASSSPSSGGTQAKQETTDDDVAA